MTRHRALWPRVSGAQPQRLANHEIVTFALSAESAPCILSIINSDGDWAWGPPGSHGR
ncbi:MAG: hypothetical protein AVDCRST_MAG89-3302 [uncultured Gemmatimonadetes bacterium]|uniref:Uncharacterized protein n=1 Tax=uncultured Gemmatimonadota bacterium TaxID=203437 RepID=A0A6J4M9W5_9BACT|nr:MAG: hypothetical protein AVDCRST_MAG89-3302 [uncultured Gemmatimonadota bacterium]